MEVCILVHLDLVHFRNISFAVSDFMICMISPEIKSSEKKNATKMSKIGNWTDKNRSLTIYFSSQNTKCERLLYFCEEIYFHPAIYCCCVSQPIQIADQSLKNCKRLKSHTFSQRSSSSKLCSHAIRGEVYSLVQNIFYDYQHQKGKQSWLPPISALAVSTKYALLCLPR